MKLKLNYSIFCRCFFTNMYLNMYILVIRLKRFKKRIHTNFIHKIKYNYRDSHKELQI